MKARTMYKKDNKYYVYTVESIKSEKEYARTHVTYNFRFEIRGDKMMIRVTNNFSDYSDYALVKLDKISIKSLFSYSELAVEFVEKAIKDTGMSTQFLKKVAAELMA